MSYSLRFEIFDLLEKRCSDIGALMRALDGVEEKIYVDLNVANRHSCLS